MRLEDLIGAFLMYSRETNKTTYRVEDMKLKEQALDIVFFISIKIARAMAAVLNAISSVLRVIYDPSCCRTGCDGCPWAERQRRRQRCLARCKTLTGGKA